MNTMSSSANSIQSQSRPTSLYSIDQILGNNNTQQENQSVFGKLNIINFFLFGFRNLFLLRCRKSVRNAKILFTTCWCAVFGRRQHFRLTFVNWIYLTNNVNATRQTVNIGSQDTHHHSISFCETFCAIPLKICQQINLQSQLMENWFSWKNSWNWFLFHLPAQNERPLWIPFHLATKLIAEKCVVAQHDHQYASNWRTKLWKIIYEYHPI